MKAKKATKEMRQRFQYIPFGQLDFEVEYSKYKTERGLMNHLEDINEQCRRIIEAPDVKRISMSISWARSQMWGMNPHLEGRIQFTDGRWEYVDDISCGGCGYDKLSTVMADFLNRYLKGMLWRKRNFRKHKPPYGVTFSKGWLPRFDGGVGARCTIDVLKWLGFKLVSSSSGKTWDFYELERK